MNSLLYNLFPFLRWFPLRLENLRADLVAGITVALVLVPQSMAYAQLASLPVVYGLYASFVPVIVAALWGSCSQLHTGPVAMLSLMSAAAILPLATPGSDEFIALSIMLAFLVGVLRFGLGLFRLGAIVNLLSSPVIVGFTNAAALIIGLSQLNKILGVPFPRSDSYLADLWGVLTQIPDLHWPTLLFALGTWVLIELLRRASPRIPAILAAVAFSTVLSAVVGFEHKQTVDLSSILEDDIRAAVQDYRQARERIDALSHRLSDLRQRIEALEAEGTLAARARALEEQAALQVVQLEMDALKTDNNRRIIELHSRPLAHLRHDDGRMYFASREHVGETPAADAFKWRFVGIDKDGGVILSGGGAVVGDIPAGLPHFSPPHIDLGFLWVLLPSALVMALIGFMEATSISKAIAIRSGERVDTSKELIGQGLANIAGSFFGAYTVSGSFSRSAVAARSGAKTGMFAIISAIAVVLVLLFFTRYLYHLPQAVLAVIVMMAVFGLIRVVPLIDAWRVDRVGAVIGIITFVATLAMAPRIANGILVGVVLTVLYYLIRTMKPRAEVIGIKPDGTYGGARTHGLQPLSNCFVPVRFDGALTFVNVAYFEDVILEAHAEFPHARAILVIASGINDIDASGVEKVHEVGRRLREAGVSLMFSGLKHQIREAFKKANIIDELGQASFFADKRSAIATLTKRFAECDSRLGGSGAAPDTGR